MTLIPPRVPRRSIPAAARLALLVILGTAPARAADYVSTWAHPLPQGNALGGAAFEDASAGYAVGDRGAVLRTADGGASWEALTRYPEFATDLEDLVILAPGTLLAVGAPPGIFRSDDAGETWSPVVNPSTGRLVDVEFVTGSVLSAVGEGGQVLRSTDSGATWSLLANTGGDLEEQLWSDASNGYVLGTFRVRRTTDGGASWSPVPGLADNEHYTEAFFTGGSSAAILSDFKVWKTTNSGSSWAASMPPGSIVYFGNAVDLGAGHWLVVSTIEGASVYETTNGGASWKQPPFHSGAGGFRDFDRLSDGTLITVSTEGDIFRSTDDGLSWSNRIEASGPPRHVIGALSVGPGGNGAAGTTGTPGLVWYRTTDWGAHWAVDPAGPEIAFTREIAWWDADHAVVAGDIGKMWRTTDGGATWVSVAIPMPPANGRAWHVSLPAPGVAFASINGQTESYVYRTTDYGAAWERRSAGIPAGTGLTSVSFPTSDLGFACGYQSSQARIYKTTDAGGSWSPAGTTGITNWPWDMQWFDEQNGLASVYNAPGGVFRTTNGGASWQNVRSQTAYDLAFSDGLHGAAGPQGFVSYGSIAVTEDGGATWSDVELPATTAGSAISAMPDGFFVGGSAGVMLRVTRAGAVGIGGPAAGNGLPPQGARIVATSVVGPRIELAFELPAAGPAELAVFDPAGRRVALLARGDYPAGTPVSVAWDGRRDAGDRAAAGVYFATLRSAGTASAVKITLVR